jgi:hypothetical protein
MVNWNFLRFSGSDQFGLADDKMAGAGEPGRLRTMVTKALSSPVGSFPGNVFEIPGFSCFL